jgi:cytochrome c oxidase assembly protein subunit 15
MSFHLTAQLAALGLVVALLPLSIVWAATDANKYRKLAAVTLFLTFDLIVFGGFTRLTDSGLGCPDWPGCYGQANPLQAHADISAAQSAMPTGPVTVTKAWIEMIHRYLAMAVGVLIVSLMVVAWRRWWLARSAASRRGTVGTSPVHSPWLPTFLFGFVCLQGAFGAWTVTLKLQPIIVTTHLLLGLGLLGLLTWLKSQQDRPLPIDTAGARLRTPALLALGLLAMQLALGGWVSTNYAALACTDFPLCHGEVIPTMDYAHGFALWRQLGMTASGEYLPFAALTAIHWTHRNFAFVVIAMVAWVGLRAIKIEGMRNNGRWLLAAIGAQFLTGVSTIYLQWPLALAVAHNAGAAALVLLLVMLNYKAFVAARNASAGPVSSAAGLLSTP